MPSGAPQLAQSLREGVAALPFFFFSLPLTGEVSVRPPPLPLPLPPPPLPPEVVAICDCLQLGCTAYRLYGSSASMRLNLLSEGSSKDSDDPRDHSTAGAFWRVGYLERQALIKLYLEVVGEPNQPRRLVAWIKNPSRWDSFFAFFERVWFVSSRARLL